MTKCHHEMIIQLLVCKLSHGLGFRVASRVVDFCCNVALNVNSCSVSTQARTKFLLQPLAALPESVFCSDGGHLSALGNLLPRYIIRVNYRPQQRLGLVQLIAHTSLH